MSDNLRMQHTNLAKCQRLLKAFVAEKREETLSELVGLLAEAKHQIGCAATISESAKASAPADEPKPLVEMFRQANKRAVPDYGREATEATTAVPSTSDELDNGLDHDDIEALLIAYDHAKANGLPLSAIQPSIDIVKELLENSLRAANAGPLPDYRLTRGILKYYCAQPPAQQPAGVDEDELRAKIARCIQHDWGDGDSFNASLFTAQTVINEIRPYLHPQPAQQEVEE